MNYAEAVALVQDNAPELIVMPQSLAGSVGHVAVSKTEGGPLFSITLPDSSHLLPGKTAAEVLEHDTKVFLDGIKTAQKVLA